MRETQLCFTACDGFPLAATLYESTPPAIGAVLVNGATGVPRRYYTEYARFLAQQGFVTLTYDYRGMGGSRTHANYDAAITMRNWGERDYAAAIDHVRSRYPQLPLLAVGHSVGGQLLGLAPNNHHVTAAIGIAAQSGYWRLWPRRLQPRMAALWYLLIPTLLGVSGRIPAGLMGEELPAGVAREWARWCRNPEFICDEYGRPLRKHFESWHGQLRSYAIADDEMYAPKAAVETLTRYFTSADREVRYLRPKDHGLKQLGHFGFFRPGTRSALWQETADWLRKAASPSTLREAA